MEEPMPNLVGYIPRVGSQSPGIPLNYNFAGTPGYSNTLIARDEASSEEDFDPYEAEQAASDSEEGALSMADKSSSSKETFGLPYDPPSDLDVDRYAPRIDPFLPQPMDFRSKSLENNDKLKNPAPKGSNSLTCYKCGHACNNRVGVPVICNSPLEQCATYYDPQTLEVKSRTCRLGPPGCFVSDDGKYGCLCATYLCNNYKMYKRRVGSEVPSFQFDAKHQHQKHKRH
jgi:hypothetical protein